MSVFQSQPGRDAQEFWAEIERTLGVPVLGYALGQYLSGREITGPLWGLVYVTENALYFHHFPQHSWFSALTQSGGSITGKQKEITIEVPLGPGVVLTEDTPRGWFARLRGANPHTFAVTVGDKSEPPVVFTVEQAGTGLPEALRRVVEGYAR